jgi:hypothetical protein
MGFSIGMGLLLGSWSLAAFGGSAFGAPVHATNAAKTASLNPTITSIIGQTPLPVCCAAVIGVHQGENSTWGREYQTFGRWCGARA